jgi:uncharacterized membrane protein
MMSGDGTRAGGGQLCVLLACFDGHSGAAHARGKLMKRIGATGDAVVDDVIVSVDAKGQAHVHDPHRVLAGTLTSALTWGAFGLLAGGDVRGLIVWGVLGAICGGVYAYASEHVLAKSDLAQIGKQLAPNSSAVIAFVESADEDAVVAAASTGTSITSSAAIDATLSSHSISPDDVGEAALSMTLLRYDGEHTARKALASVRASDARVELVVEVSPSGRPRVVSPTEGVAAMSKSDIISWGGFGVVFGLLVGFFGNGGIFSALEDGLVTGLAWALFGLVAGALYGLWAGRAASSRRVKSLRALLPPNTSTAVIWIAGTSTAALDAQARSASRSVTLYFHPSTRGAVLQTS